jgi:LacI family transcriptional regulator
VEMKVDIKIVAEKAGVSPSTVSRALSGKVIVSPETKKRVLQAVKELNYQPNVLAKSLKEGRSKTIGLFLPNLHSLIFPAAIRGITEVAKRHGYTLVLFNTDEDLETEVFYIENLRRRLVDGYIFSTATAASHHILELKKQGYPVVLLVRSLNREIDTVVIDNFGGGYQATQFLLGRGYRKIAIINGTLNLELYRERFRGYREALAEAGVAFEERLSVHETVGWEDGYRAIMEILERGERPEAVFATSDPKALGVIKALKEKGLKVPDDVAVIGYDNLEMSELMDPPLTTMAQPFYEAGTKAAERLLKLIGGKGRSKPVIEKLEPQLFIRQTVGYRNS